MNGYEGRIPSLTDGAMAVLADKWTTATKVAIYGSGATVFSWDLSDRTWCSASVLVPVRRLP